MQEDRVLISVARIGQMDREANEQPRMNRQDGHQMGPPWAKKEEQPSSLQNLESDGRGIKKTSAVVAFWHAVQNKKLDSTQNHRTHSEESFRSRRRVCHVMIG